MVVRARSGTGRVARSALLLPLLGLDAALLSAHVLQERSTLLGAWRIDADHSYPELVGYAKVIVAAVLLRRLQRRSGSGVLLAWTGLLLLIVADDAGRLHERGGRVLAGTGLLPALFGLSPSDVGELVVWTLLAAGFGAVVLPLHRGADEVSRLLSVRLAVVVGVLGLFAVAADAAHQLMPVAVEELGVVVEDGGEMVCQSILVAFLCNAAVGATVRTEPPCRSGRRFRPQTFHLDPSDSALAE